MDNKIIGKDDYEEPRCLLDMHPEVNPIPVGRVLDKLDAFLGKNDYDGAANHLIYWCGEADACNDMRGKLTLLNEQIGLYRKTGKKDECFAAIEGALTLADSMDIGQSATYGTTLVNAATGYKAFDKPDLALPLYRKAQGIYEAVLEKDDSRLGGLYNNMALALVDLKEYEAAQDLYYKAIKIMEKQKNGELEVAITHLNLADLVVAKAGLEEGAAEIEEHLKTAEALLKTDRLPKDGYYAFVCEKCAPVFGYYGYFATQQELDSAAREIYERS